MVKPLTLSFCLLGFLLGCVGARPNTDNAEHPNISKKSWSRLWAVKAQGFISDLNVSGDGSMILVSTVPDRESEGNPQKPLVTLYDAAGKLLWSRAYDFGIRAQAISENASTILISTHDDKLVSLGPKGIENWTANVTCKPYILEKTNKIVCYHDEDAESNIAFDVFNFNGKKTDSSRVKHDVLNFKLSYDQTHSAIGMTHGQTVLFGNNFNKKMQKKVPGEIIDIAISGEPAPELAVLYDHSEKKTQTYVQHLALFDQKGNSIADTALDQRLEQIEFAPDKSGLYLYGNRKGGQSLSFYGIKDKELKEHWQHRSEPYANYSSSLTVLPEGIVIGFDDIEDPLRHSHLRVFSNDGSIQWDIPLLTDDGAYLYLTDADKSGTVVATAMDDGKLMFYRLNDMPAPIPR